MSMIKTDVKRLAKIKEVADAKEKEHPNFTNGEKEEIIVPELLMCASTKMNRVIHYVEIREPHHQQSRSHCKLFKHLSILVLRGNYYS